MATTEFITPTKKNPVFIAECDWFGYIQVSTYKQYFVEDQCCGDTFDIDFTDAINRLHKWIKDSEAVHEYPKCKFNIYMIDGSIDRDGQTAHRKVYTISASKAKKFLL